MEDTQERSVIVLGRTGCGKSTFIRAMMLDGDLTKASLEAASKKGINLPEVSWSVTSCTKKVDVFSVRHVDGRESYKLIDCMGLQDTDKEDTKSVQQMAKVLSCLTSLVGIVYIIDGRVTPTEVECCNYIFQELLADVKPADVLVVRTKHEDWYEFNDSKEKGYLKDEISETIRDAAWIAVDFDKYNLPDEGSKQVDRIKTEFSRWTQPLQLSDKTKIACNCVPDYLQLLEDKDKLAKKQKELANLSEKKKMMEITLEKQDEQDAETLAKIKKLLATLDKLREKIQEKSMVEKIMLRVFSIFRFSPGEKKVCN